jgi:hypothetical protein
MMLVVIVVHLNGGVRWLSALVVVKARLLDEHKRAGWLGGYLSVSGVLMHMRGGVV